MNTKNVITIACLSALIAVMLGALGAHALKQHLSNDQLASFETGVKYQFYHSLAILLLAALSDKLNPKRSVLAFRFFIAGMVLFSGSIYLLSLRDLIGLASFKWLGPLTPFGGLCLMSGWICFLWAANSANKNN